MGVALARGTALRSVAETVMNAESSAPPTLTLTLAPTLTPITPTLTLTPTPTPTLTPTLTLTPKPQPQPGDNGESSPPSTGGSPGRGGARGAAGGAQPRRPRRLRRTSASLRSNEDESRLKETRSINNRRPSAQGARCSPRAQGLGRPLVPYRDSTLTWLLKDALGGNAHTVLMVCHESASPGGQRRAAQPQP